MKNVSQKIIHIRHNLRVKSRLQQARAAPKRSAFRVPALASVPSLLPEGANENDTQSHIAQLKKEWQGKTRNVHHIRLLLRQTREYRIQQLKKHPNGSIKFMLEEFPCFQDGKYVSMSVLIYYNILWHDCCNVRFSKH